MDIVLAAIINTISAIWLCRNSVKFKNKVIHSRHAISLFMANTKLSGFLSKGTANNSIEEFKVIELFSVECHAPKADLIKQVDWIPPLNGWLKCNSD